MSFHSSYGTFPQYPWGFLLNLKFSLHGCWARVPWHQFQLLVQGQQLPCLLWPGPLNYVLFMLGNTMKHFGNKGPIVQTERSLIQGTVQSSSVTLLTVTSQLYKSSIDECRTVWPMSQHVNNKEVIFAILKVGTCKFFKFKENSLHMKYSWHF